MASRPPQLPPKYEVALALLQAAPSVFVHLDPRPDDVLVPAWFKKQPQLVLQIGLNMAVQIPDLDVGSDAISCTLSFNRNPEFCRIPYSAIFGLVGEDGRGMVWPDSIPPEVAASAQGRAPAASKPKPRRAKLQVAKSATSEASGVQVGEKGKEAATEESGAKSALGTESKPKEAKSKQVAENGASPARKRPSYLRVVK